MLIVEGKAEWVVEAFSRSVRSARELFSFDTSPLKVIVACSGGEDSHVLLHLAATVRNHLKILPHAVYVDHGLRSVSAEEGKFVATLAEQYGLPVTISQASPWDGRENVEGWARRVRYELLEKARIASDCALIMTAHHENDQAETVLMRLLNGRLLTEPYSVAEYDLERRILRPFLKVGKPSISAYLKLHLLPFVTDSMNLDFNRARTKIRQQLLPNLASEFNPAVVETLALSAERFGTDERYLLLEAERAATDLSFPLPLEAISRLHAALQWRVIAICAERLLGEDVNRIGYKAWARLIEVVRRRPGELTNVELGFGYQATVARRSGVEMRYEQPAK